MPSSEAQVQLTESLRGVLATEPQDRAHAEHTLARLSCSPGYAAALAHVLTQQAESPTEVRQMAGSALRRFVKERWQGAGKDEDARDENSSNSGRKSSLTDDEKSHVRSSLLHGLGMPMDSKVETALCLCVAKIAEYDWPENWPDLTSTLVHGIYQSFGSNLQSASMRCLSFISSELEEPQLSELCPALLPSLCELVTHWTSTSIPREQIVGALSISRDLLERVGLSYGASTQPTAALYSVEQQLPHLAAEVSRIIMTGLSAGIELVHQALRLVLTMFCYQSKHISKSAFSLMNACWYIFQNALQSYLSQFVYETEQAVYENNISVASIVMEIAEILSVLLGIKRYRNHMKGALPQLIEYCILYSQATQVERLQVQEEPSVAAGIEETSESWKVRDEFAVVVSEVAEHGLVEDVLRAVQHTMQQSVLERSESYAHWWQGREAALFVCSTVSEAIEAKQSALPQDLSASMLLQNLLQFDLNHQEIPDLLRVRAFSLAGELVAQVNENALADQLVSIAGTAIEAEQAADAVRLAAVKAAASCVNGISHEKRDELACRIAHDLSYILLQSTYSSANDQQPSLQLDEAGTGTVVETLATVFNISSAAANSVAQKISPTLLHIWEQYFNDPIQGPACNEAIKTLCRDSTSAAHLHELAIPPLLRVLDSSEEQPLGLPEAALDLLESLLASCGDEIAAQTCSAAFPKIVSLAERTSDPGAKESACMVLRAMVRANGERLHEIVTDATARILRLCTGILKDQQAPTIANEAAAVLTQLVRRMPQATQPHLKELLDQVSQRMINESNVLISAAIVPLLARMVLLDADGFIETLFQHVQHAQLVLECWINAQNDVQGSANIRASTIALARLAVLENEHVRRAQVRKLVQEEGDSGTIRTRSKAKQLSHLVDVPFAARALELVADALIEQAEGEADVAGDEEIEDDEEETESADDPAVSSLKDSELFANLKNDQDENDLDADAADDPYRNVCLRSELVKELLPLLSGQAETQHALSLRQSIDPSKLYVLQATCTSIT